MASEEDVPDPNGLCFSPDHKTFYLISTGKGPGDTGPGGEPVIFAFDLQGTKITNKRLFTDMTVDGVKCGPDDMCADVFGNLWCSSNAPLGHAGGLVFNPAGKLIGRVRLPEVCANLTFGGPKRDQCGLKAAQRTSLSVRPRGESGWLRCASGSPRHGVSGCVGSYSGCSAIAALGLSCPHPAGNRR